jgi:TRAP-type C4-dicarboxylate transport system permease small subunit
VLSQGAIVTAVVLLPFWYRKRADRRPRWLYRLGVTSVMVVFLGLTIWGGWPEQIVGGEEELIPISQYAHQRPMIFVLIAAGLVVFYALLSKERRAIRRILDAPRGDEP